MNNHEMFADSQFVDRVIDAYQHATKHFDNADLVVVFDESKEPAEQVDVFKRQSVIDGDGQMLPDDLMYKLRRPAKDVESKLTHAENVFWCVLFTSSGDWFCTAFKATLLAPHGNA